MDIVIQKIYDLINQKNMSARQFQIDCGLNHSSLTEWKKGKALPSRKTLKKIADYFELPITYFYGDIKKEPLFDDEEGSLSSAIESKYIKLFNELDDKEIDLVTAYIQGLIDRRDKR